MYTTSSEPRAGHACANDGMLRVVLANSAMLVFAAAVAMSVEARGAPRTARNGNSVRSAVDVSGVDVVASRGTATTWTVESDAITAVVSDECALRSVGGRGTGADPIEVSERSP